MLTRSRKLWSHGSKVFSKSHGSFKFTKQSAAMFSESSNPGIFTILAVDDSEEHSSARLGKITLTDRNAVKTPNFFAVASRGAVPHLTPDVLLEHTHFGGVHMALEDFIEKAPKTTPPIMNCPARKATPLHTFTALPSSFATFLAPRRTPAVTAPLGNTDHSISTFTSVGFQTLSNDKYINYVQNLRPDMVVGLADVPYGTLPGTKRIEKMGDRTSEWLDSLISGLTTLEGNLPAIFAPLLPIDFHAQLEYLHHVTDELADSISGLAFYSSSLLPDIPATTAVSRLPRLSLDEPPSPHHILRQISLGMDLFAIPFVGFATDSGLALTFKFAQTPVDTESLPPGDRDSNGVKPLAIDLSLPSHATSTTPLMPGCECYACTAHHRAYIHHLLSAKEMLCWVLLQIHNHHVLSEFFSDIQASISAGTFESNRDAFERRYESDLLEGTGQRPRARGYHFKSEGPGEKKRNKPAWGALGGDDIEGGGEDTPVLVPDETSKELEDKGFAEAMDK